MLGESDRMDKAVRLCGTCGETKPSSEFYKDGKDKEGTSSRAPSWLQGLLPYHKVAGTTNETREEIKMRDYIVERVLERRRIHSKTTTAQLGETAKVLKVSKSTVHEHLTKRLSKINSQMASKRCAARWWPIKAERHIRVGRLQTII